MTRATDFQSTIQRLEHAVGDRQLAGELLNVGQKLLTQLKKPTQVTIIGYPGVGKSSLLRMMVGSDDLPDLVGVSVFEVRNGTSETVRYETDCGGSTEHDGRASQHQLPAGVFRVIQTMPIPQLVDMTLAEVSLAAAPDLQARALEWAMGTTDITIWCSQDFDAREAATWSRFPEPLKDHSFLALTKADQLQMKGTLSTLTARFEDDCAEEFLGLFPIATKQAIAARLNGSSKGDLWAASGGKALYDTILSHIDTGRKADLDYVQMLLAHVSPEDATGSTSGSDHAAPEASAAPEAPQIAPMRRNEALDTALTILQDCADEMVATSAATPQPKELLAHSAQAAQALATLLMDAGSDDAQINALREDVLESEQVIMLLQLEGTDTAARDAVSALLQLKKEMSEVACA
jgi:hypothetical protein